MSSKQQDQEMCGRDIYSPSLSGKMCPMGPIILLEATQTFP